MANAISLTVHARTDRHETLLRDCGSKTVTIPFTQILEAEVFDNTDQALNKRMNEAVRSVVTVENDSGHNYKLYAAETAAEILADANAPLA